MDIKNIANATKSNGSTISSGTSKPGNFTQNISSNTSNQSYNSGLTDGLKEALSTPDESSNNDDKITGKDLQAIGAKVGKEAGSAAAQAYGIPKPIADKAIDLVNHKRSPIAGSNPIVNAATDRVAKQLNKNKMARNAVKKASNFSKKDSVNRHLLKKEEKDAEKQAQNVEGTIDSESTDLLKKLGIFFKNNPGIVVTIVVGFFAILIPVLLVLIVASAIMFVMDQLANFAVAVGDVLQIIGNGFTLQGWRTDQNVYLFNIEETSAYYIKNADKATVDEEKVRYYVNAATFYANIVSPEVLDDMFKDENSNSNTEKPENIENENDLANTFIGSSNELSSKYGTIKKDPKDLIKNMFECGVYENNFLVPDKSCSILGPNGTSEKWYFSEEKYEEFLLKKYVPVKYILGLDIYNCSTPVKDPMNLAQVVINKFSQNGEELNCIDTFNLIGGYDSLSDDQKNLAKKITEEIMSQAKSFYLNHNANDQSNYNAYNIAKSGITVKDPEGNIIGVYSLTEYVEKIVERDAGEYDDEIKKAYALNIISKLLSRVSNGEIIEEKFFKDKVTDSTKKAVDAVKDLKIMKDEKVYYDFFDFEKAKEVEPLEYEAILEALFGDDIEIEKSISNGLQLDPVTGFYMRVEIPDKDDVNYYGSNKIGLIGECAWYATNRAREITRTLGVTEFNDNTNGNWFCYKPDAEKFKTCWPSKGQKCEPKQGAIISWDYAWGPYDAYGHVAIIEQVNGNEVIYSDSGTSRGSKGLSADTIPHNQRYANCTENPKKPCITTNKKSTIADLSTGSWGRNIICYIYLTEPLEVKE